MTDRSSLPSDEDLTAFLDGELPAEDMTRIADLAEKSQDVADRIAFLSRADLPFADAFAPLLEAAPIDRLEAMLDAVPEVRGKAAATGYSRRQVFTALAASIVAGIAIDRSIIVAGRMGAKEQGGEWRAAVAQYMALYTSDTLAGTSPSRDVQLAQLATVNSHLGLALTPEDVALSGKEFRRAQILAYDKQPLAQLTYLDPATGPMALCITLSDGGVRDISDERRSAMNIAFWSGPQHAIMLIGHADPTEIHVLAQSVKDRITV